MKTVSLTLCGSRYSVNLDDDFAAFVEKDLDEAGITLGTDNKPDRLLRAYLRLAKQITQYEKEIDLLAETLEAL